jgi:hypothetical protein
MNDFEAKSLSHEESHSHPSHKNNDEDRPELRQLQVLNSINRTPTEHLPGQSPKMYNHLTSGSNVLNGVSSVDSRLTLGSRYIGMANRYA